MHTAAVLDLLFMRRALALAQAQLGRTAPNPAVGCVIVTEGVVVGEGATGDGGRPHAEEQALEQAGPAAMGACAFVTLEPCARRSAAGPGCAERLIAAGIRRLVVAAHDPHPNAGGAGLALARDAGVLVETGLAAAAGEALVAGFAHRVHTGMPLVEIARDPTGFDAPLVLQPGETVTAALDRLGRAGFSRVYAAPESAAASALEAWLRSGGALQIRS